MDIRSGVDGLGRADRNICTHFSGALQNPENNLPVRSVAGPCPFPALIVQPVHIGDAGSSLIVVFQEEGANLQVPIYMANYAPSQIMLPPGSEADRGPY